MTAADRQHRWEQVSLFTRILLFFGFVPRTWEQCALAYQGALCERPKGFFNRTFHFRVFIHTELHQRIFTRLGQLTENEFQAKHVFFATPPEVWDWEEAKTKILRPNNWPNHPRNIAAVIWLSHLDNPTEWYQQQMVRNMATLENWGLLGGIGGVCASEKHTAFAQYPLDHADTADKALAAADYAVGTTIEAAAREKYKQLLAAC